MTTVDVEAGDGALKLEVVFEADEDGWTVASCRALPGCHSQGRMKDEALANIREAIEGYLASMGTHGDATGGGFRLEPVSTPYYRHACMAAVSRSLSIQLRGHPHCDGPTF